MNDELKTKPIHEVIVWLIIHGYEIIFRSDFCTTALLIHLKKGELYAEKCISQEFLCKSFIHHSGDQIIHHEICLMFDSIERLSEAINRMERL